MCKNTCLCERILIYFFNCGSNRRIALRKPIFIRQNSFWKIKVLMIAYGYFNICAKHFKLGQIEKERNQQNELKIE